MTQITIPQALALAKDHLSAGRLDQVEIVCQAILKVAPSEHEAYRHYGIAAHYAGQQAMAEQLLQQAATLAPEIAGYRDNLSVVQYIAQKFAAAEESARQAIQLDPSLAPAHINLGNALQSQGRFEEAVAAYLAAVAFDPQSAEAHNNLGVARHALGFLTESLVSLRRAIELRPDYLDAYTNLGPTLIALDRLVEAETAQQAALAIDPRSAKALNNLGNVRHAQGRYADAVSMYRKALSLREAYPLAWTNLGLSLACLGRLGEAEAAYRRSLELQPAQAMTLSNLGLALQGEGRLDEAIESFEAALRSQPDLSSAFSNILSALQYHPETTPKLLKEKHVEWNARYAAQFCEKRQAFPNDRDAERPLRIGFVSPDLGRHPVGWLAVRCLESVDHQRFQWFAYSDRAVSDDISLRIANAVTEWKVATALSNAQLAELIRSDRIDILFDLGGHTMNRRLETFARKPAPVQISWIGYVGTTGLETMDYVLGDRFHLPAGSEADLTERPLRMPNGYICFDPPSEAPEVGPLPSLDSRTITFGCFNNSVKINRSTATTWAEILRRVPESRLILKCLWFEDPGTRRRYQDYFAAAGINIDRIEFQSNSPRAELLAQYGRVDIALDPFPYSGGITTCEALWMGVPVITRPGATFASRHSLSHLFNAGLPELAAASVDDYVDLAVRWAQDRERLSQLRAGLRDRVRDSPLCDATQFALDFETRLREAWREWSRTV